MTKPVINVDELEPFDFGQGEGFAAKLAPMGKLIGMEKLGAMLTVVEPGKKAFPHHVHHHNEEMFIILEGEGTYRFGDDQYPVRAGDVLAAPPGGPERAHQIINTGDKTLKYIGISTKLEPEVAEYPDSGKFLVFSQTQDGAPITARFNYIGRADTKLGYWDGEDG